jgi:hypothetical protein
MGGAVKGNRLTPEAIQKINEFVNASIEKNIKGKDSAKINDAKLMKQVKADVNKQIAAQLKGAEASVKNLVDQTVDKTIADSLNAAKNRLKPK